MNFLCIRPSTRLRRRTRKELLCSRAILQIAKEFAFRCAIELAGTDPIGEPALLLIGYAAGSTYRPLETGEAASSIVFGGRPQGIRLNADFTPGARSRQGLALTQFELGKMYRVCLPAGQAECDTA
ncbi:hypothetical protein M1D34_18425 [Ensifer sp. D2-11]